MMIDIKSEHVVRLSAAPRHLPAQPNGKRVHVATVYRWSTKGCRGVRLETIQVGGTRCTSLEALQRFAAALGPQPEDVRPVQNVRHELDQAGL